MANLIIQENGAARTAPAIHGEEITIQTPCDCSAVTGVQIAGVVYPFYDAAGKALPTGTGLFAKDSLIRVLIDTVNTRATIINHAITPASIGAWPLNTRGTLIPKNADLNDYKTPGKYYSYGTAISSTLSNSPDTYYGFELLVDKGFAYANDLTQIAFLGPGRNICTRNYNSNTDTWGEWTKYYTSNNKPTAADVGAPTLESNGRINGAQACSSIAFITSSRALTEADIGKTIVCYQNDVTVTIPAGMPSGAEFEICRWSSKTVTIVAASGTLIRSTETARTIKNQYGVVSLKRISTAADDWLLVGDLG